MKSLLLFFLLAAAAFATPFDDLRLKLSPADRLIVDEALNDVRRDTAAALQAEAAKTAAKEAERAKIAASAEQKLAAAEKLKEAFEQGDDAKFDEAVKAARSLL